MPGPSVAPQTMIWPRNRRPRSHADGVPNGKVGLGIGIRRDSAKPYAPANPMAAIKPASSGIDVLTSHATTAHKAAAGSRNAGAITISSVRRPRTEDRAASVVAALNPQGDACLANPASVGKPMATTTASPPTERYGEASTATTRPPPAASPPTRLPETPLCGLKEATALHVSANLGL
jgi:hypothetical protein